jgi:hypothetical protein
MSALSVTKHIYNILIQNEDIKSMVGNNIFPLVAEDNATFPFVIIKRNTVTPNYHKMGVAQDLSTVTIAIVTTAYAQSIEISEKVRSLLENYVGGVFQRIRLQDVNEAYIDDAYVQELNFECYVM